MQWTLFEAEMPKEQNSMFAPFYGTPHWTQGMFLTVRNNLLFTIEHKGQRIVVNGKMIDGKPTCDYVKMHPDAVYIAWMPYPEPLKD